jgi:hypothetical protein
MVVGIGASGIVGVCREDVEGTYQAPEQYLHIRSESLEFQQDTQKRRPIVGSVDVQGALTGWAHVEGELELEVIPAEFVYLLQGMRGTLQRTGETAPYIYTFTPTAAAVPSKTLSITVVRNGEAFGYTGCVIGTAEFTIDEGTLVARLTILGQNEEEVSVPTAAYETGRPGMPGDYNLEIPNGTPVCDTDEMTLTIEDNPEAQYRLCSGQRFAEFIKFGERDVTMSVSRDFHNRDDYDSFKALTAQEIQFTATTGTDEFIEFTLYSAIKESYQVGLSGQGDLVRGETEYFAVYNPSASKAYQIRISSAEAMTV